MARSERYIVPSDAELQRLEEEAKARELHIVNRQRLAEKCLLRQRKETLLQLLTKLYEENIYARWSIEAELEIAKPVEMILQDLPGKSPAFS